MWLITKKISVRFFKNKNLIELGAKKKRDEILGSKSFLIIGDDDYVFHDDSRLYNSDE